MNKLTRVVAIGVGTLVVAGGAVGAGVHISRSRATPAGQPPLALLDQARLPHFLEAFNANSSETRILALLSPTCGVCRNGASAIQGILSEDGKPVRVFVVWEPVLEDDLAPPDNNVLARIPDARASQYWDPGRSLSNAIIKSAGSNPSWGSPAVTFNDFKVVWDFVAVFPPGAHWNSVEAVPAPSYHGRPVVDVIDPLRGALAAATHIVRQ